VQADDSLVEVSGFVRVCLPSSVRLCFGQPCSPFEAGALPVLRPARRIHIRLRGRVLCNPPRLKGFRPASALNKAAHGTLGSWANGACVRLSLRGKARLLPRAASTVRSAILRRRDTASSSRARPLAHHANAASCDRLRGSAFGLGQPDRFATGACRRAVPLRTPLATAYAAHFVRGIPFLTHAPLARPSAMARFFSYPLRSPTSCRLA